jgi:membrane-associated phospholipid phosphatase
VALAVTAVPFGLLLLFVQDRWPPLERVDHGARVAPHRVALDHTAFAAAMKVLSTAGSAPAYFLLFTGIAVWLVRRGRSRLAAFVAVANLGGAVLNEAVKALVRRVRPVVADPIAHAAGLGFPSGHAQAAVVGYSVLLLPAWKRLGPAWRGAAVVLGIGLSRVALSVHCVGMPSAPPGSW